MGLFSRKPKMIVPATVALINSNDVANIKDYVVLDVETTGLDPSVNRIIEVAAVRIQDGQETGRYQTFVNPKTKVPKGITNLTGIKNADIKNGKPYEEMAQDVSDFIGDLPIVAHNAPFDVKFVAAAMSLIGREYSTPAVDTVGLAKLAHPNLVNYKLNTLIRHLSLTDHEQTHRAMDDVLCTKKLFDNCRRIIYANNSVHAQKKTVDKALESVESAKTAVDVFLAYGNAEATLSEAMAMDPDSTEIVFGDVGKFLTKNFSPAIHNVLTKEFEKEKKAIQKLKTRKAIVSRIERFQNVYNANADKMTGPQKTKLKNYVSDLMKVCDMVAPR